MPTNPWTDDLLDQMRMVADDPADRAVSALFATRGTREWGAINGLLDFLVDNAQAPPPDLPPELTAYLQDTASLPPPELREASAGEACFAEFGPEILMLLGCFSLPAAYAAAKGVQVLCRTEFLERATRLRLLQTAQMIVDVMAPGGLGPGGTGIRAAQKVRLLHAAIRHLILTDARPWNTSELGKPINQEDLAGTMLTFSCVILDGLAKFDIEVPPRQAEAYFQAWCAVGRLMGIHDVLIPPDLASGRVLMKTIQRRQIAASPEGQRLTADLRASMGTGLHAAAAAASGANGSLSERLRQDLSRVLAEVESVVIDPLLTSTVTVLMRHCFADETDAHGNGVADLLAIPPAPTWLAHLVDVTMWVVGHLVDDVASTRHRRRILRWINMRLVEGMLSRELGPGRALFRVPAHLHDQWKHASTS
ncbi:MAG TPA: oxygenase MpaB family protein [Vicinamibacterales bacterium]|nr:oxygenase MpaB family protein [Vicinamibacterales bacterium]